MSRVGNSAITIPSDVTLSQQDGKVIVKGKMESLLRSFTVRWSSTLRITSQP